MCAATLLDVLRVSLDDLVGMLLMAAERGAFLQVDLQPLFTPQLHSQAYNHFGR